MDKIISAEEFNKRYGSVAPQASAPMTLSAQEFQAKYGEAPEAKPKGMGKASNILGGIFGGQKIGEAIGTKLAENKFNKSPLAGALTEQQKAETFNMPTGKQIAGDIGRVALNFAPVGKVASGISAGAKALGAGAKLAKPISQIATGGAVGYGADVTTKLAEGQEDPFKAGIGTAVGAGIGALPIVGAGAKAVGKAIAPKSSNIMNRVVRLTPTDANKFKKIAGKEHGQYLTETGNLYAPEKVAEREAIKFTNSIKEADDALATLQGNFKTGQIDDALDMLVERELKVSSPNTPSPDLNRVNFLSAKHKTVGLNMSEINEAKRLFERNVKLGYNKLVESDKVQKATNIDDALREWQFKKAKDLGLKNLDQINKQTQISKTLVNAIGKQLTGRSGNEAVNLTDWIVLSNGDPTAVSAFLVKKALSNKNLQAGTARLFAPRPFKKPVTAQFGGKSGLPALIPGRDYSLPKPNNPKYQPIKLPQSVRETNLGLDEVRATRSKPMLQLPAKIESKTAYTESVPPKKLPSKPVAKIDSLLQEARKYKSAEEFVNNSTELTYKNLQENPYSIKAYGKEFNEPVEYHRAGSIKKNGDIWLTDNSAGASQYSSAGGRTKIGSYIVQSKNPLIIDTAGGKYANGNIDINKILTKEEVAKGYTNNPTTKQKFIDYAKKNGYDAVQFADSFPDGEGGMRSLVVWDKSAIKTKSQLTDIWNKANKGKLGKKPPKLK